MANVLVASNTGQRFNVLGGDANVNGMREIGMAMATVVFNDFSVVVVDHDWFVEVLRGERQRMKEAISPFAEPLTHKIMRRMAVIASRDMVMGGLVPGVKMVLHDVAVCARLAFRRKIRSAFCIVEGEHASAQSHSDQDAGDHRNRHSEETAFYRRALPAIWRFLRDFFGRFVAGFLILFA